VPVPWPVLVTLIVIGWISVGVHIRVGNVRLGIAVRIILISIVRLRIGVRAIPVVVRGPALINHIRSGPIVVDYDPAALWSNDHPSSLARRRDRQEHTQKQCAK
jgi:hypothetical protein